MGYQSSGLRFAIIGHQDNWTRIFRLVNSMRAAENNPPLSPEEIKAVYPYIPPRKIFDIAVNSTSSATAHGFYVETFISPDELDIRHLRKNIKKVKDACACAADCGADIVSLGGFTSILLESGGENISQINNTFFTTGNTLTAALICEGIERACKFWKLSVKDARMLVIGSTGDIGSAVVTYFEDGVHEILLAARQPGPLKKQQLFLDEKNIKCRSSVSINELLPDADIVICVASSLLNDIDPNLLPAHAIICDAGYPKNISTSLGFANRRLFIGGMSFVINSFSFDPDHKEDMYEFPVHDVAHGCIAESIVLAMENIASSFSFGRGNITKASMIKIKEMAARHGIICAPLFNEQSVLKTENQVML